MESSCEEHNALTESVGSIKGQLSILIKMIVILVAGMAYAITQNHKGDLQLLSIDSRLANTEKILNTSKKDYDERIALFDREIKAISNLCCGELDALK